MIVDEVAESFKESFMMNCPRLQQYKMMTDDTVAIEALKDQGMLAITHNAQ